MNDDWSTNSPVLSIQPRNLYPCFWGIGKTNSLAVVTSAVLAASVPPLASRLTLTIVSTIANVADTSWPA